MSDSERFLARWSRLKRAAAQPQTAKADDSPPAPPVDLASLPPIESIAASTDIGLFLKPGVPEDLARAALRRAWTADPLIREFIGIAEYQWDLNAEQGLLGFGALGPDHARNLLARAVGSTQTEAAAPAEPPPSAVAQAAHLNEASSPPAGAVEPPARAALASIAAPAAESTELPATVQPVRRSHGGALPR